jgi:hypothetical protein
LKRNYVACVIALAVLAALIALFPPFQITWGAFFHEPTPWARKLFFLLRVYLVPCGLSFGAIFLLQMQARVGALGAEASSVFPLALLASGCMMTAFRSMASGVGGVPGYAMGMALAYTVMSRIHSVQPSGRFLLGRPMIRVVWKGEIAAQRRAAAELQARLESEQRIASTSNSNSAKNSSFSLSRAEAGI